jgi:threonine dehydrogenase-like Zn-dependent dehydrogenase
MSGNPTHALSPNIGLVGQTCYRRALAFAPRIVSSPQALMKDWLHAAVAREPAPPAEGPDLYKTFRDKKDGCIKVMVRPD